MWVSPEKKMIYSLVFKKLYRSRTKKRPSSRTGPAKNGMKVSEEDTLSYLYAKLKD
jgi:hypothetical protein